MERSLIPYLFSFFIWIFIGLLCNQLLWFLSFELLFVQNRLCFFCRCLLLWLLTLKLPMSRVHCYVSWYYRSCKIWLHEWIKYKISMICLKHKLSPTNTQIDVRSQTRRPLKISPLWASPKRFWFEVSSCFFPKTKFQI